MRKHNRANDVHTTFVLVCATRLHRRVAGLERLVGGGGGLLAPASVQIPTASDDIAPLLGI
jgi:hypothetical protein